MSGEREPLSDNVVTSSLRLPERESSFAVELVVDRIHATTATVHPVSVATPTPVMTVLGEDTPERFEPAY